ncbi:MAG TPA: hypothetical protein VKG23_15485 [Thermoanaerobaculia bacterium]|jgi:hypothetical protein|nr:hypothetical protein [Thermoanaerobaculia bacterium]
MANVARRFLSAGLALFVGLVFASTLSADNKFVNSDDAKQHDEPQKFLPDYDKLVKGKDADWVYFPDGDLKKYKTVLVKEFENTGKGREAKEAASEGKEYMEQWMQKQGFDVVEKGPADITIQGNVFNAWEPSGAARAWGGWAANPGVGMELLIKNKSGQIVAEVRQKAKGSTIHDAVENGLEDCAKSIAKGK